MSNKINTYTPETAFRREGNLVYNLRHYRFRKGVEEFHNDIAIKVEAGHLPQSIQDEIGEVIATALNRAFGHSQNEFTATASSSNATPETDKVSFMVYHKGFNHGWETEQVYADFARQIERDRDVWKIRALAAEQVVDELHEELRAKEGKTNV